MSNTCEVCSLEPSKYRCPTCELTSCSLTCSQSHKIYCAPKHPAPSLPLSTKSSEISNGHDEEQPLGNNAIGNVTIPGQDGPEEKGNNNPLPSSEAIGSSKELQELFHSYPRLRSQLRDIYQVTLEDAWIQTQVQPAGRGRRPFQKGKGPRRVNRGPWTSDKGFRRGLGRVRKSRERCEEGIDTGKDAEGFMRFVFLVNGENYR